MDKISFPQAAANSDTRIKAPWQALAGVERARPRSGGENRKAGWQDASRRGAGRLAFDVRCVWMLTELERLRGKPLFCIDQDREEPSSTRGRQALAMDARTTRVMQLPRAGGRAAEA